MDDTTNEAAVEQPVDSPAVETSDKPTTDDAVSSADAPTDSSGPADSATTASDADAPTADVAPALTNFADVVVAAMATQAAATVAEPAAEVVVVDRESVKHLGFIQQQERDFEAKLQNQASAVREQLIDTTKLPPSYSQNSHREKACLSFVANFRRQYTLLYPGRKELILVPKNEVGVQV